MMAASRSMLHTLHRLILLPLMPRLILRTLCRRSFIMYSTMAACSWWTWLLHFTMVILGGFLIVNLTIAVIYINFNKNFVESKQQAKGDKLNSMHAVRLSDTASHLPISILLHPLPCSCCSRNRCACSRG